MVFEYNSISHLRILTNLSQANTICQTLGISHALFCLQSRQCYEADAHYPHLIDEETERFESTSNLPEFIQLRGNQYEANFILKPIYLTTKPQHYLCHCGFDYIGFRKVDGP